MSWDKEPPKKEEFEQSSSGWDQSPPTEIEVAQQSAQPQSNVAVAGARNFAQGATGNFSDEIAGGVEAIGRAAGFEGVGHGNILDAKRADGGATLDWEIIKDAYKRARDNERADIKKDQKERPVLATTANIAGAVASPLNRVLGGTKSLVGDAALIGGAMGAGSSESESLGGVAVDSALGAATGAVVAKGVDKVSGLAKGATKKISEKANELAEKISARGIGAERGTIKKHGMDKVREAGRYALDNKILSGSTDDMIGSNEGAKKAAMNLRNSVYDVIDERGASAFNPIDAAYRVTEKIMAGKKPYHKETQDILETAQPLLEIITSRGNKNIGMRDAQELVETLGKKAKFDTSRSNEANQIAKDTYMAVRDYINESAEKSAEQIGVSGLKETLQKANKKFSTGKIAQDLLKNKQAREQGNKLIGLTDLGAGTIAGAAVSGPAAIATVAGKKVLEKYGASVTARSLDKVAKYFARSPQLTALAKANPAIIQSVAGRIGKSAGERSIGTSQDGDTSIASIKGMDKFAVDGLARVAQFSDIASDAKNVDAIFASNKGKELLAQASTLKENGPAMQKIIKQLKNMKGAN